MTSKLCERCQYLDFASLSSEELPRSHRITYTLGSLFDISSRQSICDFCKLVVQSLSAAWKQLPPVTIDSQSVQCTLSNRAVGIVLGDETRSYSENFAANAYKYSNCRIVITCDRAPPGCPRTTEIQLVEGEPERRGLFDDIALFSRRPKDRLLKVNFDLARDWFSYCRKSHGHECERGPLPQNYQDSYALTFRLIDVSRDCVCDAEASWSYVALSYVWGQAPMLKLVQANKVELYSSGALASDKQAIPQTIRDAILVVKRLGEQYLWVDALCITQDDNVEKSKVIGEMDLIYSRANLTIVAAFGNDASAGLPGLQSGTRMVDPFEARMTFNSHGTSKQLTVARSRPTRIIDDSKWNSRGWTYQEKLFSHRMLLFTEEQVLYWCGRNLWCEDTVLETDDARVRYEDTPLYRFRVHNNPSVAFLKQAEESSRISMFEEYANIVSEFCRRDLFFEGDILDAFAGLLRSFRDFHNAGPHNFEYCFGLPSVCFDLAIQWTPPAGSRGLRKRNAEFRSASGATTPFPSWSWTGWTGQVHYKWPYNLEVETLPEIKWYLLDLNGLVISLPTQERSDHPLPRWKPAGAPVDVPPNELEAMIDSPSKMHLLMLYTSSALLPVFQQQDGLQTPGSENSEVREYFIAGEGKGWINLHAEWLASHPQATYEFIVISRSGGDFLSVMLIERLGDIAIRVGVGKVSEEVWVQAELEWKLIKLG
ncbi:Heterokaryon incompatibility protein (HET) domain containing protein [Hyaloscypha variabilis]